jgi:hypothetical protein
MWLIISEPEDMPAIWTYSKLKDSGLDPIEQVTPEEFSYAASAIYSLNREGSKFVFDLRDGRKIRSDDIRGILNRVTAVPVEHLVNSRDTQYAIQEFYAFFLGWLSSLDVPIINYPVPFGLPGRWRHLIEWTWLANISDLPTVRLCHGSDSFNKDTSNLRDDTLSVIVANGEVFGADLPEPIVIGCKRLSEKSKTDLLGITFSRTGENLIFVEANPFPDLQIGGDRFIKKIKEILLGRDHS